MAQYPGWIYFGVFLGGGIGGVRNRNQVHVIRHETVSNQSKTMWLGIPLQ